MKNQKKKILIHIGILIFSILILIITSGGGLDVHSIFLEKRILRGIFIIIRILLSFFLNEHKNTKWIKNILIIIEIYLILQIFIYPETYFSQGEFLVAYLSIVGIFYESFNLYRKRWEKILIISIYSLCLFSSLGAGILIRYKYPINLEKIREKNTYSIHPLLIERIHSNTRLIILKNEKNGKEIPISTNRNTLLLDDTVYTLTFTTFTPAVQEKILIIDKNGNIVINHPQSKITFSTNKNTIEIQRKIGNIELFKENTNIPKELESFQENFYNKEREEILKTLPIWGRKNQKFQKRSIKYTSILAKIFPFRYKENKRIANDYLPYFYQIPSQKNKIKNIETLIKDDIKKGIKRTEGTQKYKEYFKKLFLKS